MSILRNISLDIYRMSVVEERSPPLSDAVCPLSVNILSTAPILGVVFQTPVVQPLKTTLNKDMTSISAEHTNEALWLLVTFHPVAKG